LFTREGRLVQEHVVNGDVRFVGSNMRATHNLAHNIAVTVKRSISPEPAALVPGLYTPPFDVDSV
jgi:hypothetical protein